MTFLLFLFGIFLALGMFLLTADLLRLPRLATQRAMLSVGRQEKKQARSVEALLMGWAIKLAPHIHMDEYIPINFDPDAVFGTNVASAFNDDWLNVYANFGWKTGRIDSALTVCLVCSDGHEFEFFYPLTSAEQVQLWNQMDAYCHQQNGQSLGETRTALLREQAEEGLEIRL